jgi:phosphatidylserine decarboxylase
MWILKFLPKNVLSYCVGWFALWTLPRFSRRLLLGSFAKAYQINLEEAEKSIEEYSSFDAFFTRRLKPGLRLIDAESPIVHPADSFISSFGPVQQGQLMQAKGKMYSVEEFLKIPKLQDPHFFITYYLCPTDYHRVHSPVQGRLRQIRWIPGQLWPVNRWSVENVDQLFSRNERVVCDIETAQGLVYVVLVGATNVGKMTLSFDPCIVTNDLKQKNIFEKSYDLPLEKGQELGMFHLGSTVIVVYPSGFQMQDKKIQSGPVRLGQSVQSLLIS